MAMNLPNTLGPTTEGKEENGYWRTSDTTATTLKKPAKLTSSQETRDLRTIITSYYEISPK